MPRFSLTSISTIASTFSPRTIAAGVLGSLLILSACGGQTEFIVKDLRETTGKVEVQNLRIDNASGKDTLRKDEKIIKNYRHIVDVNLNGRKQVDESRVREKVLDLYKLTPNEDKKVCVVPVEVAAGSKLQYDIEWTESIREGKIVEQGGNGEGEELGTYTVITDYNCQVTGQNTYQ